MGIQQPLERGNKMPIMGSAVERVEQVRNIFAQRTQLDAGQIARIEGMYRSLLGFSQDKKTIDALLFEADEDAAAHFETHVYEVLKTLTWCGEGQINFERRRNLVLEENDNPNLYLFGPTVGWQGQTVDSRTLEKRVKKILPERKEEQRVVFFYQLERLLKQPPSWEMCFPINILLVSAEQYPEYRDFIAAYLKKLEVKDVLDVGERPEFAGLADMLAFNIVGTPSKRELLKDPSQYAADIAFINLMCTQKPLLDKLQLGLIQLYKEANPDAFVRATANEQQVHIMTTGEPHPEMTADLSSKAYRELELERKCADVREIVKKLNVTSRYGLRYFHFLRPDTSLLAKWGNPLALPKLGEGEDTIPGITITEMEQFYITYATSLVHHFLSGDDLERLLHEKGYVQSQPNVSHEQKLERIDDPGAAFQIGAAYLIPIETDYRDGLWLDPETQVYVRDTGASFRRFLELASEKQLGDNPLIEFNDELCETGIIGAIDKERRYPEEHNIVIGKPTSHHDAWTLYYDWLKTQEEGLAPNFQTPKIRIPIPITNLESFVVEDYIIGPTVCGLLGVISQKEDPTGKYAELRSAIYDVEMERFVFYIDHFTELIPSPDGKPEPVNLAALKQTYIDNFYNAFEHRARFTDVNYSDRELDHIRRILHEYDWGRFIKEDTVRRNLGATFRNSIAQTGHVNISLDEFLQLVSKDGKISKTELTKLLFRIDQGNKYGVPYEDLWEMLDFSVGGLNEDEKLQRAQSVSSYFSGLPEEASFPFRLYRATREADLFIMLYGPKIFRKMQAGIYTHEQGNTRLESYKNRVIGPRDLIAFKTCEYLPRNDLLRKELSPYIERLLTLRTINYEKISELRK